AGKTGTTSSNKDGWFVGFSSGITTGVWMGRDDARAVRGLQGGRAPAQAFAAYMRYAVKDRPVEKFDTELNLPEWQLEPDEEYLLGDPDDYYFIDEQGNLVEPGRRDPSESPFNVEGELLDEDGSEPPPAVSEDFLEEATGGALPQDGGPGPDGDPPPDQPAIEPPEPPRLPG
nr:penicillin-binding protein [Erythrobacter sp.]